MSVRDKAVVALDCRLGLEATGGCRDEEVVGRSGVACNLGGRGGRGGGKSSSALEPSLAVFSDVISGPSPDISTASLAFVPVSVFWTLAGFRILGLSSASGEGCRSTDVGSDSLCFGLMSDISRGSSEVPAIKI
jgi:hypothetical protein